MSEKKGLESIVPPAELCAKIPDGTFEESSLIWFIWERNGKLYGYVVPREMKDQFANALPMILAALYKELPAPTLAEILDDLYDFGNVFLRKDESGWMVMLEKIGDEEGYGYEADTERDPDNPATAALRLWKKINGVEVKDE